MAQRELPQVQAGAGGSDRPGPVVHVTPLHADADGVRPRSDRVATEEPLEIRVRHGRAPEHHLGITMRTPGNDFELAAGLLAGEGVVRSGEDIDRVQYCLGGPAEQQFNVLTVALRPAARFDPRLLARSLPGTSACGVCGKASIDSIATRDPPLLPAGPRIHRSLLQSLPERLRAHQRTFARTGGMHAAGLFSPAGDVLVVREDVGRHNAVDKVTGALVLSGKFPAGEQILQVSGRASFEIVQKALMAGIPFLSAVGAPSSLAVDLAGRHGMTLAGFVAGTGFNVYSGAERIEF